MIRIYPDNFDYAGFEKKYKKIFAKSYKTKKILNCKLDRLNSLFPRYNIPSCFDDFIIMKPDQIVGLYLYYLNDSNFKNEVDTNFKRGQCLAYRYFRNKINDFYKNNDELIGIKTCCYCNSSYINVYKNKEGLKIQCDFDHFIPQSKCPLFTISLYNFVPSCQICNSRIKRSNIYFNNQIKHTVALLSRKYEKLFPSSCNYNYDNTLKFILVPKLNKGKFLLTRKFQDSKDYFEIDFIPSDSEDFDLYKREADLFEIINRYNCHKVEFLNYIDKRRMYSRSYMNLIGKLFPYHNSVSTIIEAGFNFSLRKSEKLVFDKIYNDIDNIFDE